MKRRQFLGLAGGAVAWPLAAHSEQPTPVVGYLSTGTRDSDEIPYLAPFRQGLKFQRTSRISDSSASHQRRFISPWAT
jgi:hypothetical protein